MHVASHYLVALSIVLHNLENRLNTAALQRCACTCKSVGELAFLCTGSLCKLSAWLDLAGLGLAWLENMMGHLNIAAGVPALCAASSSVH